MVEERCVRNSKNQMKQIDNNFDAHNADGADDGDDDAICGSRRCQYMPISSYSKREVS